MEFRLGDIARQNGLHLKNKEKSDGQSCSENHKKPDIGMVKSVRDSKKRRLNIKYIRVQVKRKKAGSPLRFLGRCAPLLFFETGPAMPRLSRRNSNLFFRLAAPIVMHESGVAN
ncbi:MAG: hypothetical protein ACOY90_14520 [Candidatus Zhuqueibacterota bacterium]